MRVTTNLRLWWVVSVVFASVLSGSVWAAGIYDGGDGSQGNPFQINTPSQMNEIGQHSEDWGSYFILTADIDLAGFTGTQFNIIGEWIYPENPDNIPFSGVFDGDGHTISNFTYTSTGTDAIGLFRYVGSGGEIKDLGMKNVNVDAGTGWEVGGLVGWNYGTVSNSYAKGGNVSGYWGVGGLVGYNYYGTVSNCYATGFLTGDNYVGGLVGWNYDADIFASFWDTQTTGQANGVGSIRGSGTVEVYGRTTAEMQTESTFTDPPANWDFVCETANGTEDIWVMFGDGLDYPRLTGELDLYLGSGTEGDPYLISTPEQLNTIGLVVCDWDKHFKLMADIDLSAYTGTQFSIIGEWIAWGDPGNIPFSGFFNGNGHTISNFTYTSTGTDNIGLFRYVGIGGEIKDLGLTNVNVNAGTGNYVGGLVGWNEGTVSNCYATGTVMGDDHVGGLVGLNSGTVSNCYAVGSVTGTGWYVGGLVGDNQFSTVSNCYATGNVSGTSNVGGLVGWNYYADIFASFWDTQTTGQANGVGLNSGSGTVEVYGRTTAQMQTQTTFTDYGWDFVSETANGTDDIWRLCEDRTSYPKLSWEFSIGDFVCRDGVDLADFAYFSRDWLWDACAQTDLNGDCLIDIDDLVIFADHWLSGAGMAIDIELILDNLWMYQNLPDANASNLTASVTIIDDQYNNSSYTYDWEFVLPDDVTPPTIIDGGTANDPYCTFAAASCDEPNGLSDSGQPFRVRVTVTGNDYGNTASAEVHFGVALLGDVNNDGVVNIADRSIINAFWRSGTAEGFTLSDCDINCDDSVNVADRSIVNAIWRGVLGQNSVSEPCPFR